MKLRVHYWATEGFDVQLNGKSVASEYRPGSYVSIPARNWTTDDVVEITMPFTKYIDYGPDKLETTIMGANGEMVQPDPMWVGTLMYGPFAMTATDVNNWEEATLNVDSYLATITLHEPNGATTGTPGNLYTLTQGGKVFQPDYYRHDNTTHHFRINQVADPGAELKMVSAAKLAQMLFFEAANYTKSLDAKMSSAI